MSRRFIIAYKILCVLILALIALGGTVRAMNAGLACPDWPLCFGQFIPDYHPQVYFEFAHRVFAGLVALLIFGLNTKVLLNRPSKGIKVFCWLSFFILVVQIVMGGLTVLLQLKANIVTLHLSLGLALMACCFWIYREWSAGPQHKEDQLIPTGAKNLTRIFFLVICGQILLGGFVASHYAALVCTDFPLCQGQWFPTFKGIIGLQVMHRWGAYITLLFAVGYWFYTRKNSYLKLNQFSKKILILLFVQASLGIANILLYTPPLITVLHLTFAAIILTQGLELLIILKKSRS